MNERNKELESQVEQALLKIQTLVTEVEKTSDAPKHGENVPVVGGNVIDDALNLIGVVYVSSDEDEVEEREENVVDEADKVDKVDEVAVVNEVDVGDENVVGNDEVLTDAESDNTVVFENDTKEAIMSGETIILSDKTEKLNADYVEVSSRLVKEKEVVDGELEDPLKEIDEFPPIIVREVGLSRLLDEDEERRREKG
ncbi:uncharacterized protein LOC143636868 [Bidens hawaiensis]|uniref:uncharacterized protein LOC143636868 n=1 Tax=Bidens hawaiensis TaxID=980011 RepID=UPI0040498E0B